MTTEEEAMEPGELAVDGWFWNVATPQVQAPGRLTYPSWNQPVLYLEASIVEQPSIRGIRGGLIDMGDPDDIVRDFRPITIHGTTSTGEAVTLFIAHPQGPQQYRARHALFGAHFADENQRFGAVRYEIDNEVLWSNIAQGTVSGDLGSLTCLRDGDGAWFVFVPTEPMSLRDLGRRALVGSRTLARLALQRELVIGRAFVQEAAGSPWLSWHTTATAGERLNRYLGDWLVHPRAISLQHLIDWLSVSATLEGLDAAVADDRVAEVLELRALVYGTIAEGLHRRLFDERASFSNLTKAPKKKVRKAGKEAIASALNELGETADPDDFTDLVAGLFDMTAKQRLADIKAVVDAAVPDLLDDFEDWPRLVKDTRDYLAHWLVGGDDDDYVPPSDDDKMLVYLSLPWALRTLLLYRAAKLDENIMREGYAEKPEYGIFQANVRAILNPSG
jgi:hypothetical protein